MRYTTTIISLSIFFFSSALAVETRKNDVEKLLEQVNVSHPYYKYDTYGTPKINLFKGKGDSELLVYQARHGGDGEHTENLLQLFRFQSGKPTKLIHQNMDSVEFVEEEGVLKAIRGKYVETLCGVCDSWEVSAPEDIFLVPINIDIETLSVVAELTKEQKERLLSNFEQQSQKNIDEQLSYGRKNYPKFVESVKKRLVNVLN